MSMPYPTVSPEERFRSGIKTLKYVLIVDVLSGLLFVSFPSGPESAGQIGAGVSLLIALVLLAALRAPAYWRWTLAAWVAADLATLGIEANQRGSLSMWILLTAFVAGYVYWACTAGERGMKNAAPDGRPAAADQGT
jgi:hypothetical protein